MNASSSCRFNAIHYPGLFLYLNENKHGLPLTIPEDEAQTCGMYNSDYIYITKKELNCQKQEVTEVLTVPILTAQQAIQAIHIMNNMFENNTKISRSITKILLLHLHTRVLYSYSAQNITT